MSDRLKINRSHIDDYSKRNSDKDSYKNRKFSGKRTMYDEYTGKKIHYSQTIKGSLKGDALSNTDHITPIEKICKRYSKDLSVEELRDIANSDVNLAMTQQKLNQSKGSKTNLEYLIAKIKKQESVDSITAYNMLKNQLKSEVSLTLDVNSRKIINNITHYAPKLKPNAICLQKSALQATNVGIDAAIVSFIVSSIKNIAVCAQGKKNIEEARKDVLSVTGTGFVSGMGIDFTQQIAQKVALKTENNLIKIISEKGFNSSGEIIGTVMVTKSVLKYLNGEINSEECISEVLINGASSAAYILGMSLGGVAGVLISTFVCSQICEAISSYKRKNKITKRRLATINKITSQALHDMETNRNVLSGFIKEKYANWDLTVDKGFEMIFLSTVSNDVEGISKGLNEILNIFNKTIAFSSEIEFNEFFDDEEAVFIL